MESSPKLEYATPVSLPRRQWGKLFQIQELGLVLVILVMGITLTIFGHLRAPAGQRNTFLNTDNLVDNVATPMSYFAVMAVGATFVIISGGIDISVGSTMAMSALGTAWVLQYIKEDASGLWVIPLGIAVALAVGLLCGLLNGILVVALRMHPFIVTLGTMSIFRGIAIVSPSESTLPTSDRYLPTSFSDHFIRLTIWGQRPMSLVIMLIVVGAGWFYLSQTVGGREIYAVGGNEEAARFSGLRVGRIKLRVYLISGLTAGIGGLLLLGQVGVASTNLGSGYELTVIAAAVVGGASLLGGRGTALGALLGTLIIAMIQDGIDTLNLRSEYQLIIVGSAIIVAVAIDNLSQSFRQRRLRRDTSKIEAQPTMETKSPITATRPSM